MRIEPRVQRAIARLHLQQPTLSSRKLATAVGASPNTAAKLRLVVAGSGLQLGELELFDDAQLETRLFQGIVKKPVPEGFSIPCWDDVHRQMQQPDATLLAIWADWKEVNPDGWSYSHYARLYRYWLKKLKLTMRKIHRAGENTFIDFAGSTLDIRQPDGTTRPAQLFVAVLGASSYTFARLVWSQTTEDWIECHNHMAQFFGGVTEYLVPDNLKAGVIRAGLSRLLINDTYRAWASHHSSLVLPARSRKPRDKAKAEVGVQISQRYLLWNLRKQTWHSLEQANQELMRLLQLLNNRPFQKLPGSRHSQFLAVDQPALKCLPQHPFEYFVLVVHKRVPSDYHVEYEGHYYSVPCALVTRHVDLRVTARQIEVLHGGKRIHAHERSFKKGKHTTAIEHMPDAHRHAMNGEPAMLRAWADGVGPATGQMVAGWLASGSGFYRGLIAARGLRQETDFHDNARIESASAYAHRNRVSTLGQLRSILRFNLDQRAPLSSVPATTEPHENIRGASYFATAETEG